jgi:hypothetical protein
VLVDQKERILSVVVFAFQITVLIFGREGCGVVTPAYSKISPFYRVNN